MSSVRTGTLRLSSSRRPRRWVALTAAFALAFGGNLVFASAATAAPGDRVIFADQNLEDAVNDTLGEPHGTPVTEGVAATITQIDAQAQGIADLGGIQFLTTSNTCSCTTTPSPTFPRWPT